MNRSYLRAIGAVAVLAVTAMFSLLFAFGLGALAEPGTERLREMLPGLFASIGIAGAGVAVTLALFRRPALSPWLLCSLAPAALASVSHLGLG